MAVKRRLTVVIDCETNPFKHGARLKPFIWGCYQGSEFRHFPNVKELLRYLRKLGKCVVYAHNGGRFDFLLGLVEHIPNYTQLKIINGRLAAFKIGDLEFRDSYSLLPIALKDYKKDRFNYNWLQAKNRRKHWKKIVSYLRGDCVYLWELVDDFLNKYGVSLTMAGAAMKQLTKIHKLETPRSTYAYFNKFKQFYFGGRVECFSSGLIKGPVKVWDINSAYPFAMMEKHPWGQRFARYSKLPTKPQGAGFIELECKSLGGLAFHDKKTGTYFPDDGQLRVFHTTGWEFNQAKQLGLIKNPRIIAYYAPRKTRNFRAYINKFYELKKAAGKDSTDRVFAKLFMNSSYGKFGQDGSKYERYQIAPLRDIHELASQGWHIREPLDDGRAVFAKKEHKEKWRFYDVAVAASITGWVRAFLLKSIFTAKRKGSRVHYTDTDCMHLTGKWHPRESNELGDWKLEKTMKEMYYAGKKLYAGKMYKREKGKLWKTASKGGNLTGDQIKRVALGGTLKHKRQAPSMSILSGSRYITRTFRSTIKKAPAFAGASGLVP